MSNLRRGKKTDHNQAKIVRELRKIPGVSVETDYNDILIGYKGKTYWYEIKNPDAVSKKTGEVRESEITPSERKRRDEFKGHYRIVWTLDQILIDMGIMK